MRRLRCRAYWRNRVFQLINFASLGTQLSDARRFSFYCNLPASLNLLENIWSCVWKVSHA